MTNRRLITMPSFRNTPKEATVTTEAPLTVQEEIARLEENYRIALERATAFESEVFDLDFGETYATTDREREAKRARRNRPDFAAVLAESKELAESAHQAANKALVAMNVYRN